MSKESSRSLESNKTSFMPFGVHLVSQPRQQSGLLQFRLQQRIPWDASNGRVVSYADFWDFLTSKGVIIFIINPPRVWNLLSKWISFIQPRGQENTLLTG